MQGEHEVPILRTRASPAARSSCGTALGVLSDLRHRVRDYAPAALTAVLALRAARNPNGVGPGLFA